MEERYEREVVLHGDTTRALVDLRQTAKSFDEKVVELQSAKSLAENNLRDLESRLSDLESSSKSETDLLRDQLEVIEQENAALHEQLGNISHQLTTLNKSGADLDVSLAGNESSDQVLTRKIKLSNLH
jgi:chromosome segregation ATPase